MKISDDFIRDLAENWDREKASKRSQKVKKIAEKFGVGIGLVYRRIKLLRDHGCLTVKRKSCKGVSRIFPNDELKAYIEIIMGIKNYDHYKPDKRIKEPYKARSTARAIEIAENMGQIPKGKLTVRLVNRYAKIYGLTSKDICSPKPALKMESLYPNHVHMVDFSVCNQYYLRDSDGKVMTRPYTYKNKPNESREKIWLFMIVDHYTNVKFMKYYISPGESSEIFLEGIIEAWNLKVMENGKIDYRFPFHGAPKILYGDKGSALMSKKSQNFLKALGVKPMVHKAGNPRAKGMVESGFGYIQRDFETDLRDCPASSVEELNEWGYKWQLHHNWSIKTGEKKPRFQKWQEITKEQLREMPSMNIIRRLITSDVIRTVDVYCTIHLNNEIIGAPPELVGRKVRVWTDIDGGLSLQDVETGELHPAVERKTAVFGIFNSYKKTELDRNQERALKKAEELHKYMTPDILAREVSGMQALQKAGESVEIDSELVQEKSEEYISKYQAKIAIADELRINLGDLPGWMIEEIDQALAKTLDKDKVHKIARLVESCMKAKRNAG